MSRQPQNDRRSTPQISGGNHKLSSIVGSRLRYLYLVGGIIIAVVLVTALTLRHEYRRQITYWQERLSRVADANQRLLENWVKEREQDARLMASLACAERAIVGRAKHELIGRQLCQQHLLEQLNSVASSSGYAGAYFADRSGQVVARSDASPPLLTGV